MGVVSPGEPTAKGFALRKLFASILIVGLLAGVAVPLYSDQVKKGHDARVQANLNAIASGILAAVSNGQKNPPTLEVSDRAVTLDGNTVTTLSQGVVLGTLKWDRADNWCIDAIDPAGKHASEPGYMYKAVDGKTKTGQCA
jgi:type II secretory pathway pseudopilin PulG